jgi:hypothetical protein
VASKLSQAVSFSDSHDSDRLTFHSGGSTGAAEHASTLEHLCRAYLQASNPQEKRQAHREIAWFLYFECQPKIVQRLNVGVHVESNRPFFMAFNENEISDDVLRNQFNAKVWTSLHEFGSGNRSGSERGIAMVATLLTDHNFKLDDKDHIILNAEETVFVQRFLRRLFQIIIKLL